MPRSIYLDNSATTPVHPEVKEAMMPYLTDKWGNPSSVHWFGRETRKAVEESRKSLAELLNCTPDEVYFTPCATYANNTAILGRARFAEANGMGRHLITSRIEHPSCMGPAKHLESLGWKVTYLPVDREGLVAPAALEAALTPETSIVSIMWANNEIGSVQPIDELCKITKGRGLFFHTDGVQVAGRMPIDLKALPADSLSLSGHKFYAPKGIGALFVRKGSNVMPIIFGGGQEHGLFAGTESLPNIVGIGKASKIAALDSGDCCNKLRALQELLMDEMKSIEGVTITGPSDIKKRLPGHVSFIVDGAEGEQIVMGADLRGVAFSSASACHKGITQASHVVTALGYSETEALGSVRISCGRFNTPEEIKEAAEILARIIKSIRAKKGAPQGSTCGA